MEANKAFKRIEALLGIMTPRETARLAAMVLCYAGVTRETGIAFIVELGVEEADELSCYFGEDE